MGEGVGIPAVALWGTAAMILGVATIPAAWRSGRAARRWVTAPVVGMVLTMGLGRVSLIPMLHLGVAVLTGALLARNAVHLRGAVRWLSVVALLSWLASMGAGWLLFGGGA